MLSINSLQFRIVRMHISVLGYLAHACCSLYWGVRPWAECTKEDLIISNVALAMILQVIFMKREGIPGALKLIQVFSCIVMLYLYYSSK